jgi:PAS domain S-box-containing protein
MLRTVLNATTESVLLVDDQGTILALNQTAAQRLGKDIDEVVGLCGPDMVSQGVISSELVESGMAAVSKVFRSGEIVQFEDERDGVIYDSSVYPIFDADGKVRQAAILGRDVTAHRQAEHRAVRAERLAAMGQIATALAHAINNPLQAIRSNLEMLVDFDLGSDESRERLGIALEEIQYLARVTRGVLEFTQPAEETLRRVSAARLVRKALALAGKQLELARVQVVTAFPDQPLFVFAAPNQIVQVLLNLIANAVETMPGGGHLDITVRADGDMAALSLTSSGPRLVTDQTEHLFDPFFAAEVGDAGLGLWVSRGIVERHRGTISVQSLEDEQGVAFTVALPLHSSQAE